MNVLRILDRIVENHGGVTTHGYLNTYPHSTTYVIYDTDFNRVVFDTKTNMYEIKHSNGAINRTNTLDGFSLMLHALYSN